MCVGGGKNGGGFADSEKKLSDEVKSLKSNGI